MVDISQYDIRSDIHKIMSVSKLVAPFLGEPNDEETVKALNLLSDAQINTAYEYFKNKNGNFYALRFMVASLLKKKKKVTLAEIDEIKRNFCNKNVSFFEKNWPEVVNIVKNYTGNPQLYYAFPGSLFKQLHPLFWYNQKSDIEAAFRKMCFYIKSKIAELNSYNDHIVYFDGVMGSPQDHIYCSFFPKHIRNYNDAYQLFIRVNTRGISAGIWKGNNISKSDFENKEINCGDDIDKAVDLLRQFKPIADNLNSGKVPNGTVDLFNKDLTSIVENFIRKAFIVKQHIEEGKIHDFTDLATNDGVGILEEGITYKMGFGLGNLTTTPWIAFFGFNQKIQEGIYPVILFDTRSSSNNFEICYGVSATHSPKVLWNKDLIEGLAGSHIRVYKDSYVKRAFSIISMKDFDDNKDEIVQILQEVIDDFKNMFKNVEEKPMATKTKKIPLNSILYGPPGTGKTYNTIVKALEILEPDIIKWAPDGHNVTNYEDLQKRFNEYASEGRIKFITFHQSYAYEEFMESIKPEINWSEDGSQAAKEIRYVGKDGLFKKLCKVASENPDEPYVLIIDEINRGNVSKIFGELITLIEENKRGIVHAELPYSQSDFVVPKNLYIIGTMNTADRSVVSIDLALRRRFYFIEMMPEIELIKFKTANFVLSDLVAALNNRITVLLDKDHQIGHNYFMFVNSISDLRAVWFDKVLPLLNEYFYGDWEKLRLVVPGFVVKKDITNAALREEVDDYYYDFKTDFHSDDDFINALLAEPEKDD